MRRSYVLFWISALALIIFFWVYFPTLSRYRELKIQEETISDEIQSLDEKTRELTEERDLLKNDPAYVEKIIREEMGLVRPGEVVYKFVTESPEAPEISQSVDAPAVQSVSEIPKAGAIPVVVPPPLPKQSVKIVAPAKTHSISYPRTETR